MGKHHDKIFRYPFGGWEWARTTGSSEFTRLLYHEFRRTPELPQPYCFSGFGTEYLSSPVSPKPFTNIENCFRTVKLFMKKSLPFFGAFRTVPVMGQFKRTIRYRSLFLLFHHKIFIIKKNMAKGSKGSSSPSRKISFGKKRTGVAKKSYSKYEQKPKKYQGQGR
jgi:hypothetical protein